MLKLEERAGREVQFVGVVHNDHTEKRHVHFLVIVSKKIQPRIFQDLRITATEAALFQRKERDLARSAREQGRAKELKQELAPIESGLELSL